MILLLQYVLEFAICLSFMVSYIVMGEHEKVNERVCLNVVERISGVTFVGDELQQRLE